jgi:transcription antitermination protein NusB
MFNRRFLRIKVLQALYAYHQDGNPNRTMHERAMLKSIDKAYELYIYLLSLPTEFRFYIDKELDKQTSKYFPTDEIITPLQAMHNNQCIAILEKSEEINTRVKSLKLHWTNTTDLFKSAWNDLNQNEAFTNYSKRATHSFGEDKKILSEIYQIFIAESEIFEKYMEEQFMNWDDDQVLVTSALLKSISLMNEDGTGDFLVTESTLKPEDEKFMIDLFRKTIEQDEELTKLVGDKTKNWETDRIAIIDLILMKMALCEILNEPHIPVKVSMNEYLELAKLYSTPNSHGFINGVLDKVQLDLRKQQKINKQGRGLVE